MGNAIPEVLPAAAAVAVSPIAITAAILVLFGKHPRLNGLLYLAGWVGGLLFYCFVLTRISEVASFSLREDPLLQVGSLAAAQVVKVLLGVLFLVAAWLQWRRRPAPGESAHLPKWMDALDQFSPWKTFLAALLLCTVNPKNFALCLVVALVLVQNDLTGFPAWVLTWTFIIIGTSLIAVPVLLYLVAGKRAQATLTTWKQWLATHSNAVMCVLLLMIGVVLIANGVGGLLD